MFIYDGSLPIVNGLNHGMVPGVLFSMGSERHMPYIEKIMSGEVKLAFRQNTKSEILFDFFL